MSVLDTIDTTVTLEWAETRTVATLVHLGERVATVTALRTPDVGVECFLRLEGDGPTDTIAIDGVCVAARDGEWGEFEVDVAIARVGTTTSATALRDFIEQHQIARGGTVAVGKNRDNPEIKRFVYTLPHAGARVAPQLARPGQPAAVFLETPRTGESLPLEPIRGVVASRRDPITAPVSSFAPRLPLAGQDVPPTPRGLPQAAMPDIGFTDVDSELRSMLDMLDQRVERMTGEERQTVSSASVAAAPAGMPAATTQVDLSPATSPSGSIEDEGPILVETVELTDSQPRPVLTVPQAKAAPKKGLVARLFGLGDKSVGESATHPAAHPQTQVDIEPRDPTAVWDQPVRQQQGGRGMVSGSLVAVQQLFTVDHAVRTDRPVTFESAKKKRQGTVLRLAETKVRVRAPVLPTLYERIVIHLPAPRGGKESVAIRCEVTRIRAAETEGGEQSFDAKMSGSNDPMTMARLRQLMSEMEPALGGEGL